MKLGRPIRWYHKLPKPIKWLFIPIGGYCHGKTRADMCPWWNYDEDAPQQLDGYCHYLNEGDMEIDGEMVENGCITELTLDPVSGEEVHIPVTAENRPPFSVSLLWEQCKECGCKTISLEEYRYEWGCRLRRKKPYDI